MLVRWVPPDRIQVAVKRAVQNQLPEPIRIVPCPIEGLPDEYPMERNPYVEVHPDGLVEVWEFDGDSHVLSRWEERPDKEGTDPRFVLLSQTVDVVGVTKQMPKQL